MNRDHVYAERSSIKKMHERRETIKREKVERERETTDFCSQTKHTHYLSFALSLRVLI